MTHSHRAGCASWRRLPATSPPTGASSSARPTGSPATPTSPRQGRMPSLKITPAEDDESDHEADALELWDGAGAVRLLRRDPARRALLMERADPGTDISALPDDEATTVAIELGGRLWRPAGAPSAGSATTSGLARPGGARGRRADTARAGALCDARRRACDPRARRLPRPQHPAARPGVRRDRRQGDARRAGDRRAELPLEPARARR